MKWYTEDTKKFMSDGYLLPNQTIEERITIICNRAEEILQISGFGDRLREVIEKGWASLSSPIWSNFGTERGLPISCFGSYIDDTMENILYTTAEVGMMTKYGGGTSAYFGKLRSRGSEIKNNGKSAGSAHFAQLFDSLSNIVSQGKTRRGAFAGYQDIFHPDIDEWLDFKTEGNKIQDLFHGVCVPDWWMEEMIAGDTDKRRTWLKVLQRRGESGLPYIFYTDNANNAAPEEYKKLGLKIHASNLCTEIMEATTSDESFVCDLASMNALHFDDWKDTHAVETMILLLDAVMTEFIEKASKIKFLERSVNFAKRNRALGLGVLGYHSWLQSKMIPFESMEAKMLNVQLFKTIHEQANRASVLAAKLFGEPEYLNGSGRRNMLLLAVAPTTSSAFILNQVSPTIEVLNSNYFTKNLAKGKFTYKNPYLKNVLNAHNKDNREIWESIRYMDGSVQHLEFLTDHEKMVFKTFGEVSQLEIIQQAAQRQKYIDQGQSLNLKIHPDTPIKDVNALYIEAWKLGLKSLYYQRSTNLAQELGRNILECVSCEA